MNYTTTLNKIRAHSPCESGWSKLLTGLKKTKADDEPLALKTILEINGLDDALWSLRSVDGVEKDARLFACDCALRVAHLNPDPRVKACIEVARRFAHGEATESELDAAGAAARDAAGAAARDAAWDAARAAARDAAWAAARDAAWDAARAAARDAAWAAAWDAAWDAARAAAWDAAWAAAWDAAWDAARAAAGAAARDAAWAAAGDAERKIQTELFIRYFCTAR